MSTRQLWRTRDTRTVLLTSIHFPLKSQTSSRYICRSGQRNVVTAHGRDDGEVTPSIETSSRLRIKSKQSDRHQNHNFKIHSTTEPLINPESLSDSLYAHQKANREGTARDGVLVRQLKKRQRPLQNKALQHSSQRDVNIVHLPMPHTANNVYGGQSPPLLSEWRSVKGLPLELQFPWISKQNVAGAEGNPTTAMQLLEAEITACGEYLSPTPSEHAAAAQAFNDIAACVRSYLGSDAVVNLIGSRAAGTEIPTSDLDINVSMPEQNSNSDFDKPMRSQLSILGKAMRRNWFKDTIMFHAHLSKAHVPIIVGTHVPSGLEFQIQSTTSSYDSSEVSKAFIAEYPTARVLFKIIKQLMLMRGLNNGKHGGITSYPLLNMIIASLKLSSMRHSTDGALAASQLLAFLQFWSEFNFDKDRIVFVSVGRAFDPISATPQILLKSGKSSSDICTMSLQDPADPMNDLGRNTQSIRHVQACFIEARRKIEYALRELEITRSNGENELSTDYQKRPLLGWCLGGDYISFEEARCQLQKYGRQILNKAR